MQTLQNNTEFAEMSIAVFHLLLKLKQVLKSNILRNNFDS